MTSRFQNQSFLITGSSSGIGLATAKALLSEGANVVLHGLLDVSALDEEVKTLLKSEQAHYLSSDLSVAVDASALADKAVQLVGQLHGVVLCAAVSFHKAWDKITPEDFETVMAINLRANLLVAQSSARHLRATQGSMVAVSSTNALRANKNNLAYDTSKAGLNHMFRDIALELREDRVRVNVVMPGGVDTPMLETWMKDYAGEDAEKKLASSRQSGLLASPADIAMPILFLLSHDARWITGQTLIVDAGGILDS